jgi:enoyl-CoA hydratase
MSATGNALIVSAEGSVGRIRINLPDTGNKIPQAVVVQLAKELQAFAQMPQLKVVVISAEGAHFCQGRDGSKAAGAAPPSALALRSAMMEPIIDVYKAFRTLEIPIVALVQGEAHGFGAALAGSADLTIAADDARFSFPELKSDMPPTLAMATVMDRVPQKALAWMVYTNSVIGATEAQQVGLVSTVVPAGQLEAAGEQLVGQLCARSRDALIGVKQYLAGARLQDFAHAADYGRNLLAVILSSK